MILQAGRPPTKDRRTDSKCAVRFSPVVVAEPFSSTILIDPVEIVESPEFSRTPRSFQNLSTDLNKLP